MSALAQSTDKSQNHGQTMKITKLQDHIGAEVTGIDLRQPVDAETRQRLYDALAENVALVIRDQTFEPAEFQAAVEMFGELMEDQNRRYLVDGLPMISVLSNRHRDSEGKQAKVATNANWHTDHTNQELPPKFTVLYALELPDSGGGTSVANISPQAVGRFECRFRGAAERTSRSYRPDADRKHPHQHHSAQNRKSGCGSRATGSNRAADDAAPGEDPPGARHQGNLVS